MKLSINEVPVCNERILKETALENKISKAEVEDIVKFIGQFIHEKITDGRMEGVMLPEFGKFKPKRKKVIGRHKRMSSKENGTENMYRAIVGKPLKTYKDETI